MKRIAMTLAVSMPFLAHAVPAAEEAAPCLAPSAATAETPKARCPAPQAPLTEAETVQARAWIAELGAPAFAAREAAQRNLLALGPRVLPLLPATPADEEVRARCDALREELSPEPEEEKGDPARSAAVAPRLGEQRVARVGGIQAQPLGAAATPVRMNLNGARLAVREGETELQFAEEEAKKPEPKKPTVAEGAE